MSCFQTLTESIKTAWESSTSGERKNLTNRQRQKQEGTGKERKAGNWLGVSQGSEADGGKATNRIVDGQKTGWLKEMKGRTEIRRIWFPFSKELQRSDCDSLLTSSERSPSVCVLLWTGSALRNIRTSLFSQKEDRVDKKPKNRRRRHHEELNVPEAPRTSQTRSPDGFTSTWLWRVGVGVTWWERQIIDLILKHLCKDGTTVNLCSNKSINAKKERQKEYSKNERLAIIFLGFQNVWH